MDVLVGILAGAVMTLLMVSLSYFIKRRRRRIWIRTLSRAVNLADGIIGFKPDGMPITLKEYEREKENRLANNGHSSRN